MDIIQKRRDLKLGNPNKSKGILIRNSIVCYCQMKAKARNPEEISQKESRKARKKREREEERGREGEKEVRREIKGKVGE